MKWIEVDTKIKGYGRDIIFANNRYYLAHYLPSGIAYSDDLVNWHDILFDNDKMEASNLAYGNGVFLVSGNAGTTKKTYIYHSLDGITFHEKEVETGCNFSLHSQSCKFLNNRFIFLSGYRTTNIDTGIRESTTIYVFETTNGNEIKRHDFVYYGSKEIGAMDISYGNGIYVIVGMSGSIFISKDLKNWKEQKSGVSEHLVGVHFGKGLFVVTGANGIILTSQDGITWTKQISNTTSYLIRTRYANGVYMAVGYNGTILSSIDGKMWNEENDPFTKTIIYGLLFANNKFVVSAGMYGSTSTIPIAYCEVSRELTFSGDDALYIYDKDLNFLGVIDEFISLIWRRKYFEAGDFELVVAPFKNNIRLLKKDNIIIRQDYTEAALIDTIEITDDGNNIEIKLSGAFMSYLLHRRIIKKRINYSGNVIDGMKKVIQEMTPISKKFEIETTAIESEEIEFQATYQNVYDYQVKLSKLSNIGFRIVPNIETKVFRYENYKGLNRTKDQIENERYCFSTTHKNIEKTSIIDTSILKCNYALVGGQGEDENRILIEEKNGNPEYFDLIECFVDAKNESNSGLTAEQYHNVLATKGKEILTNEEVTIETTALATDYKKKWDLGDVVDILVEDYIMSIQKRIVEVEEVIENGTRTISPVFGNPLSEKIDLNSLV